MSGKQPGSKRATTGGRRPLVIAGLTAFASVLVLLAVASVLLGSWTLAVGGAGAGVVGAVVIARRPGNRVGHALLAFGAASVLTDFTLGYLARWLEGAALPLARLVATVDASVFALVGTTGCALLLVYPTGQARGRYRWVLRGVISVGLVAVAIGVAWSLTRPVAEVAELMVANTASDNPAELAASLTFVVGLPLSVASLISRYRSADSIERAQIRWLVFAAVFLLTTSLVQNIVGNFESTASVVTTAIAFLLFPVAVGIAITRYRLFEIDRIISRTISYALLTAVLVGVYVGLIFLLRDVLPISGALPVAASTLAAALLFNPLRRRVQDWVDRRFNRARYDADRVIQAFASRLRDSVEPADLSSELRLVLARTLHPAGASIWLRGKE